MNVHGRLTLLAATFAMLPALANAAFPGKPLLLSAQGATGQTTWVAYENGDVLHCDAASGNCRRMQGLPEFSSPVSLNAGPAGSSAWVGWSDGALFYCEAKGECRLIHQADGPVRVP